MNAVETASNFADKYNRGKAHAKFSDLYSFGATVTAVFREFLSLSVINGLRVNGELPRDRKCLPAQ